jgi:sarcosine oxidase
MRGSLQACARHDLPHEVLDAETLRRRFPGYQLPPSMVAVYQPDAGILLPERCIVAHVNAALGLGAEVHTCEPVLEWGVGEGSVWVRTGRETYRARRLVVTAGSWARNLVPMLSELAVPELMLL